MKRKQVWLAFMVALPLALAVVLALAWQMSRGSDGSELLYFLAAVVVGYPLVGVLAGFFGVSVGLHLPMIPLVAVLGYMLALGMGLSSVVGLTFAFWGAVVTVCAIIFALRMYGEGKW